MNVPPVALVQTWLFLLSDDSLELKNARLRADYFIEINFGSVEIAKIYIEQHENQISGRYVDHCKVSNQYPYP